MTADMARTVGRRLSPVRDQDEVPTQILLELDRLETAGGRQGEHHLGDRRDAEALGDH
jgi:hypothetical protein